MCLIKIGTIIVHYPVKLNLRYAGSAETKNKEKIDMNLQFGNGYYVPAADALFKTHLEATYSAAANLLSNDIRPVKLIIDTETERAWIVNDLSPPHEFVDYHIQNDNELKREIALNKLTYEERVILGLK
jgi:hypothetical protein